MASLCDVNFLLPLCHGVHHHLIAKARLTATTTARELVVCRSSQLGLLRVLSNPAAMKESVCTSDEAWRVHDILMADDRFVYREEIQSSTLPRKQYRSGANSRLSISTRMNRRTG